MKQRQLGKDGPMVGEVALGCMSFAGFYGAATQDDADAVLSRCQDLGVTHLDTANVYGMGKSETMMGKFLGGKPQGFVIATKAAISRGADGSRSFCNERDYVRAELEGSLKRLGLDRVDLFYMHRRDPSIPVETVMEHLLELVDEGMIGGIGFSEIAPATLRKAAAVGPVRAVQSEYSMWTRLPELGMIQACAEVGAAFVPFSSMGRGMFGDAPPDRALFPDNDIRRHIPRFQDPHFDANLAHLAPFRAYAKSLNIAPATLATAWVLDKGPHLIPIPGTRSVAHLEQLVAATHVDMTDAIRSELDRILPAGFAEGDRYTAAQWVGVEQYC